MANKFRITRKQKIYLYKLCLVIFGTLSFIFFTAPKAIALGYYFGAVLLLALSIIRFFVPVQKKKNP